MVAVLVDVGTGKMTPQNALEILQSKDPDMSPMMAPPWGLYFHSAHYVHHEVTDTSDVVWRPDVVVKPSRIFAKKDTKKSKSEESPPTKRRKVQKGEAITSEDC